MIWPSARWRLMPWRTTRCSSAQSRICGGWGNRQPRDFRPPSGRSWRKLFTAGHTQPGLAPPTSLGQAPSRREKHRRKRRKRRTATLRYSRAQRSRNPIVIVLLLVLALDCPISDDENEDETF